MNSSKQNHFSSICVSPFDPLYLLLMEGINGKYTAHHRPINSTVAILINNADYTQNGERHYFWNNVIHRPSSTIETLIVNRHLI